MDFDQLEYFRVTATYGSISQAAQALHITQPALSRSIAKLEDEVGVPLFDRRNHRIVLNAYGRTFLQSTEQAFLQIQSGIALVQQMYSTEQGILTLASPLDRLLSETIQAFMEEHPDIRLRGHHYAYPEIEKYLLSYVIELGIFGEYAAASDHLHTSLSPLIHAEDLAKTGFVLVYNQALALPETSPISLAALRDISFVCDCVCMTGKSLASLCAAHGFVPTVAYEVENFELVEMLLRQNPFAAFLPEQAAKPLINRAGEILAMCTLAEEIPPLILRAAWLEERGLSKEGGLFLDFLKSRLSGTHPIFAE